MSLRSEEVTLLRLAADRQTEKVQALLKRQKNRERLANLQRSAKSVKQSDEFSASIPEPASILSPPTTPRVKASRSTKMFGTPPKLVLPTAEKLARSRVQTRSQRRKMASARAAAARSATSRRNFQSDSDEGPTPPRRTGGDGKKPPPGGRSKKLTGRVKKKKTQSDDEKDEEPPPQIRTARKKRLWKEKQALKKLQRGSKRTEAKRLRLEVSLKTKKGKVNHAKHRHEAAITRAKLHKQQQAQYRKSKREARQHYSGLAVKEARLQIKEEGPGVFSVRSSGMSPKVQKHIKLLLNRVKGSIEVNGQKMTKQKAYTVIVNLLSKNQVAQVTIVK
jgi:hypothetical protein